MQRESTRTYYFDSLGVEAPPLIVQQYINLGSDARNQEYDESFYGASCLNMIYLIDQGIGITSALNVLIKQFWNPGLYDKFLCLCCSYQGTASQMLMIKAMIIAIVSLIVKITTIAVAIREVVSPSKKPAWGARGGAPS